MPPLPAGIPPLEETSYSRERILDALRNESALPSGAIAVGTLYADAIEADVIELLERARREELDEPSERLLFRGVHILGGTRKPAAYRPLVALLRGPQDRVDWLFGDAITENMSQILAGLFDGDDRPLFDLGVDPIVDSYVREAALNALTFLVFERRIDRAGFETFLLHFDEARLAAADDDVMWHGWMTAVATLGMTSLEACVRAAFADGRISPGWCDEEDFDDLIRAAIQRPDDPARLKYEQMGYIEDVLAALEKFPDYIERTEHPDINTAERWGGLESGWEPGVPSRDPFRDVGRNDPCPCGSGKKFKKCCLQAQ